MPVYDFGKNNRTGECTSVGPADVVIVEGIMVLHMEAIRGEGGGTWWPGGRAMRGRETIVVGQLLTVPRLHKLWRMWRHGWTVP